MISAIAAFFWLLTALSAPENASSEIKENYPEIGFITAAREAFLASIQGISPDANGLVAGLTIGVRDMVSPELADQMKTLSLTHLVAVSGANLAIVMGVVYLAAAALAVPRTPRFVLALCIMALYVLLVGPESSVIRAAVMATFVALGLWLGRGSAPLSGLAIAVIVLLAIDPALAVDFGFALSALATAGLLILAPALFERFETRMHRWLAAGLAATVSAQLYTLPVLLLLQPSIPIYSVLANLIVEPAVAPITVLGIISVLVASILPAFAAVISYLASIPAQWIVVVANSLADLPLARVSFLPGLAGVAVVAVIAGLATLLLTGHKVYRPQLVMALLLILSMSAGWIVRDYLRQQSFAGSWQVLACDVGQGDALLIRSEAVMLIDTGNDPERLQDCLHRAGVAKIDLLVLTHFDLDHVGAADTIADLVTGSVLVTSFRDDRPVVDRILAAYGPERLVTGYAGQAGQLGGLNWRILSPSQSAVEAEDSNDASLVVMVQLADIAVLGLGDLGESGQLRLMRNNAALLTELGRERLILKVAHHGSKDQSAKLFSLLRPDIALFSVGENTYGHPTSHALMLANTSGSQILRTDKSGSIAIDFASGELKYSVAGKLSE